MELDNCAQAAPRKCFAGRPTGFRQLTPGLLKANRAAEAFEGLPEGVTAPGQLLAACKAAAPRLGLSVRLVHAIDWLFRFTQKQDWGQGGRPIVWPSAETQQTALGLSPTQVKAINRQLIESGLLTMRDSPNGKRYGHRDPQGRIVEAYGFDLSPLVSRHAEFLQLAEEERLERLEVGRLRRRTTIARKGIAQILETARQYGFEGEEWVQLAEETQRLVRALRDAERPAAMEGQVLRLEARQTAARERLESLLGTVETVPKGSENRPHITTTTEENIFSKDTVVALQESSREAERPVSYAPGLGVAAGAAAVINSKITPGELVRLAPRLQDYLRRPDPSWPEVVDAADWLRSDLDISKSLWGEACILLGRQAAAVAVAIVSSKDPAYFRTSAGGYFHGMLEKAKAHELNLDRTIWNLRTVGRAPENPSPGRAGQGTYLRPSAGATARVGRGAPWGG